MTKRNQFIGSFGGHSPGNDSRLKNRAFLGLNIGMGKLRNYGVGQSDKAAGVGHAVRDGLSANVDHGRVALWIEVCKFVHGVKVGRRGQPGKLLDSRPSNFRGGPVGICVFPLSFVFVSNQEPIRMLSVHDAVRITQTHLLALPDQMVTLEEAVGRVLRQPLTADRDVPPFNRVTMDGIAFRYEAFAGGVRQFRVLGSQFAGQPASTLTDPTGCMEVMTGAVLPLGTDTVVRYEDVQIEEGIATVQVAEVQAGQNIHPQGNDRPEGDVLLREGTLFRSVDVAVAASVGASKVSVATLPRVAIIATGDELVGVDETPAPHQIRHSNIYMIRAALRALGIRAMLHHLPDDREVLKIGLQNLLEHNDVFILSGGVSAGKADFVPATLTELGVQCHFHKVEQRPGKPLWFGTTEGDKQVVFGLPGNPVSTVMCTYKYVLPYLRAAMGQTAPRPMYAQLAEPFVFRPALTYFLPVRLQYAPDGRLLAHPLPGSGSGDFTNLTGADAFLELPADQTTFAEGEALPVVSAW